MIFTDPMEDKCYHVMSSDNRSWMGATLLSPSAVDIVYGDSSGGSGEYIFRGGSYRPRDPGTDETDERLRALRPLLCKLGKMISRDGKAEFLAAFGENWLRDETSTTDAAP